jgi:hypothetical protein
MRAASLPNEALNGRIQISSKPVEGLQGLYYNRPLGTVKDTALIHYKKLDPHGS